MLAIIGTVPEEDFPVTFGKAELENDFLFIDSKSVSIQRVSIQRGTPALVASACKIFEVLKKDYPYVYLAGDTGKGTGSRKLYEYFIRDIRQREFHTIAFHYLMPDADWCNKILLAIEELHKRPFLIADAGFMYAAKMSGNAKYFDLFTPDPGELAFLADEEAPHPFYTRGFLLQDESRVEELIRRAYEYENAPEYLLVKGKTDYIVKKGEVVNMISEPVIEALEPIGGTGDSITGIVSALIDSGYEIQTACVFASKINRIAGKLANPDPSTQISDIIKLIPQAALSIM
ncbi:NAD(P)H-hydrate dehydratase [Thermodesulfovibrio yellowstonii]|uniref:Sugar kinase n=1 Tax=Thermodesulfovibrio yellowstonii TaxID=28262 RepID=A0A9W6GD96_9BACT|nr:NAD(P)H-hydrate dehydratase [Thermodesulfovibrio islandicus]GLI53109.1 sugar kinase [Thermodesulfovibrio islandicus]